MYDYYIQVVDNPEVAVDIMKITNLTWAHLDGWNLYSDLVSLGENKILANVIKSGFTKGYTSVENLCRDILGWNLDYRGFILMSAKHLTLIIRIAHYH